MNQAIAYIKEHSAKYHLNMDKVVLMGSSAGAIMVAQYGGLLANNDYAKLLNIKPSITKSVCRRLKVEKQSIDTNSSVCLLCKVSLTHTQGKKKKKYCSDTCRMKWWNTHLDKVNKQSYSEHICFNCQKTFQSYANNKRKYCSHRCYIYSRFGGKVFMSIVQLLGGTLNREKNTSG